MIHVACVAHGDGGTRREWQSLDSAQFCRILHVSARFLKAADAKLGVLITSPIILSVTRINPGVYNDLGARSVAPRAFAVDFCQNSAQFAEFCRIMLDSARFCTFSEGR